MPSDGKEDRLFVNCSRLHKFYFLSQLSCWQPLFSPHELAGYKLELILVCKAVSSSS